MPCPYFIALLGCRPSRTQQPTEHNAHRRYREMREHARDHAASEGLPTEDSFPANQGDDPQREPKQDARYKTG